MARLLDAALPNGIAFVRPGSDNLLVADSFKGLIWNVNIVDGTVGVTLNDSSTKGVEGNGPSFTGINGLKVFRGTLYWTNTGLNTIYKVPIDAFGNVVMGQTPTLLAFNLSCDDFTVDGNENLYVASPQDMLIKINGKGEQEVLAGTRGLNTSALVGPTAVRFGRLASDRWSLYVTTNGGLQAPVLGSTGISRVDLKQG